MKTYISHIDQDHWAPKNKAYEMANDVARELNHILIIQDKVQSFLDEFSRRIREVNDKNKRCTPLELGVWNPKVMTPNLDLNEEISIYIDGVFHMTLYEVNDNKTFTT